MIEEQTKRIQLYTLPITFELDSMWAMGEQVPAINEIDITYKQMLNGNLIDLSTICTVHKTGVDIPAPLI
jgi:hypothetical protein